MNFRSDRRDKLTEIFLDTKKQYETNPILIDTCRKSTSKQAFYKESDKLEVGQDLLNRYEQSASVVVSGKRTLESSAEYAKKGLITAVHNFASSFNPGGGVKHGSSAQEECLCRCSTLYYSLNSKQAWDNFYTPHRSNLSGLHNDDIIYTPNVKVIKSDIDFPEIMSQDKWYDVNVITCAAPDLHSCTEQNEKVTMDTLKQIHIRRLKRILDTAVLNGNEVIILGAFGCGAFGNPASVVAQASKEVIADYLHTFKTIEFAVYCTPKYMDNYNEFKKIMG